MFNCQFLLLKYVPFAKLVLSFGAQVLSDDSRILNYDTGMCIQLAVYRFAKCIIIPLVKCSGKSFKRMNGSFLKKSCIFMQLFYLY